MNKSKTIDLMLNHRSIRKFRDKPLKDGLLDTLIEAGQAAATSSFIQAYSVIRITDQTTREAIATLAGGQKWVENAPEFLVFCADLKRIETASIKRDMGELEGYAEHFITATVDAALMAQNVLLAAESLDLGGVYIGGIRNDPQQVSDLLALPDLVYPVFGMCLGWPDHTPDIKPRYPKTTIIHQDKYDETSVLENINEYDSQMSEYYRGREQNNKLSDWSRQTANAVQLKKREHLLGFLKRKGFLKR